MFKTYHVPFTFFFSHFYFLLGLCVCLFTSSSNLGVPSSGVETEWGVVPAVVPQWTRLPWSLTCSRPWLTQPGTCSTIPGPGPYVCVSCALVHNRHCRFSCSTTSTVCFPQLALSVFLCFFFLPRSQPTMLVFLCTCPQPAMSVFLFSLSNCLYHVHVHLSTARLFVFLCTCPQPALFSWALVHNQHCLYPCVLVHNQHCLFDCALVHNQHCLYPWALVHNQHCLTVHLSTTSTVCFPVHLSTTSTACISVNLSTTSTVCLAVHLSTTSNVCSHMPLSTTITVFICTCPQQAMFFSSALSVALHSTYFLYNTKFED